MSREITQELLEEDSRLLKEMERAYARFQFNPTPENDQKRRDLSQKYYGENDDIRMYYQAF